MCPEVSRKWPPPGMSNSRPKEVCQKLLCQSLRVSFAQSSSFSEGQNGLAQQMMMYEVSFVLPCLSFTLGDIVLLLRLLVVCTLLLCSSSGAKPWFNMGLSYLEKIEKFDQRRYNVL